MSKLSSTCVIADVRGGMGNQLFVVACALEYARRTNRTALLHKRARYGKRSAYWDTILKRMLDEQSQNECIELENEDGQVRMRVFQYDDKSPLQRGEFGTWQRYNEPRMAFDHIPEFDEDEKQKNVYLYGYFQSLRYFEPLLPTLGRLLTPLPDSKLATDIQMHRTSLLSSYKGEHRRLVSMHIRRTDYLSVADGKFHGVLPLVYYEKAMHYFDERFSLSSTFIVFSDDIEWCKETFSALKYCRYDFLYVPRSVPDYIAFHLMAHACDGGHIIANSSFSWWAALLGWQQSSRKRTVVMPDPWMGPEGHAHTSFAVDGWIRIDSQMS